MCKTVLLIVVFSLPWQGEEPGGTKSNPSLPTQLVTEHDLISRSESFEAALAGGDKGALQSYCSGKATTTAGEEAETWSFLGLLFEEDGRRELLRKLGFADTLLTQQSQQSEGGVGAGVDGLAAGVEGMVLASSPGGGRGGGAHQSPSGGGGGTGAPEDFFEQQQDEQDFFDKLPEQVREGGAGRGSRGEGRGGIGMAAEGEREVCGLPLWRVRLTHVAETGSQSLSPCFLPHTP